MRAALAVCPRCLQSDTLASTHRPPHDRLPIPPVCGSAQERPVTMGPGTPGACVCLTDSGPLPPTVLGHLLTGSLPRPSLAVCLFILVPFPLPLT